MYEHRAHSHSVSVTITTTNMSIVRTIGKKLQDGLESGGGDGGGGNTSYEYHL